MHWLSAEAFALVDEENEAFDPTLSLLSRTKFPADRLSPLFTRQPPFQLSQGIRGALVCA